jgi:hypothetical protein
METDLLAQIHAFLKKSDMGPAYFGKLACGNTMLVSRLEQGNTVTLRTSMRILAFIAERSRELEAAQ